MAVAASHGPALRGGAGADGQTFRSGLGVNLGGRGSAGCGVHTPAQ